MKTVIKTTNPDEITGWRQPTRAEIRFGEGAIHYRDFPRELWTRNDGTLKKRIKSQDDGLFYSKY